MSFDSIKNQQFDINAFTWCEECTDHPEFHLLLLANTEL